MTSQDFLADLWGDSSEPPLKSSSYNSVKVAQYFRDTLAVQKWYKGFGIVNIQALSGQLAKWKLTGLTAEQAYAMVDLYMRDPKYRSQTAGWQDFIAKRDMLLSAVTIAPVEDSDDWDEGKAMQEYLARRKK